MMQEGNIKLAKTLDRIAIFVSLIALLIVGGLRQKFTTEIDFSILPPLHAALNLLVAILLISALLMVKRGRKTAHKRLMTTAMITSVIFLFSYVVYHATTAETKFGGEGSIRYVYFFFLITHIILAGVSLPFILFTFIRGFTGQIAAHRRMAKWVYPIWLYVAITGPICYFFLKPYYQ